MTLNFITDPERAPRPRDQMEILSLQVSPYPDGIRVKLDLAVTPFVPADRPSIELTALTPEGIVIGTASVIETPHPEITLTLHMRYTPVVAGEYTFRADLYYDPGIVVHSRTQTCYIEDPSGKG